MPKRTDWRQLLGHALNRLYWVGHLSPKEIKASFGVGGDLTSRFIAELKKTIDLRPDGKNYVLGPGTPPKHLLSMGISANQALGELLMRAQSKSSLPHRGSLDGLKVGEHVCSPLIWASKGMDESGRSDPIPSIADIPVWSLDQFRNEVRPEVLKGLFAAISDKSAAEIVYVDMKPGEHARKFTIEPLRLVHVGAQWHVDAYCCLSAARRDFVLSRILEIGSHQDAPFGVAAALTMGGVTDILVSASFVAHPDLTPDQKRALVFEFGMNDDGVLRLTTTEDRLFYFKSQFVSRRPSERPPDKLLVEVDHKPMEN